MGNRGEIVIEQEYSDAPVVLYTHWHANQLPGLLADALAKEARWNDGEYLARIIFDQISEAASETTGAGIGTEVHGDTWRVIDVNVDEQIVSFRDGNGFGADEHANESYTFESFVEEFHPEY